MKNNNININLDKVEIFIDFSNNLLLFIDKYYLDYDTLSKKNDMKNHYNWCYNKVCANFKLENIDFESNDKLRNMFLVLFINNYYTLNIDQEKKFKNLKKYIKDLFNNNVNNNMYFMNAYSIFDLSLKKLS